MASCDEDIPTFLAVKYDVTFAAISLRLVRLLVRL